MKSGNQKENQLLTMAYSMKRLILLSSSIIFSFTAIAQSSDAALTTQANVIRNETAPGGNTKTRIADMYQGIIDSKVSRIESYSTTGTNAYSVTIPWVTSYQVGLKFWVLFQNANTSAVTLNVSTLGARNVYKSVTTPLASGDISAGQVLLLFYDGTNFQVLNISGTGGGGGMTNPMTSVGDLIRGGTSGAPTRLAIGTQGQILQVDSGLPAWKTPQTPLQLTAVVISSSQINLSWNNGLYDTYTLQRADNAAFTTNLTTLYTGTALSYQNSGISKNFNYYYRIKGTVGGVDSQWFTTSAQTFGTDLLLGQNLYTFGDSYTVGQAASPSSNSYAELLKSYLGATRVNYSAGGKGIYYVTSTAQSSINTNNVGIYTCMVGLNDYRRSGTNAKTDEKIRGGLRVFLMNAIGKKFYQANTFTQTGTWTNIGVTFGNKYVVPNNSTGPGTLTATISGKNFGIAFLGSAGGTYTFGNLTITVDGNTVFNSSMNNKADGISDGAYDNEVTPYGIFVTGLSAGSHTFVFTSTIQTPIDYIVELPDPVTEYCNTVLVARPCKLPASGYAVAPANGSDAILDAGATIIQNVVSELSSVGYPVSYVNTDVLILDTSSGDFDASDPVHPTNQGHGKLFNAFKSNINISSQDLIFNNLNQIVYFNGNYLSRGLGTWDATGASDYFLPANTDGYVEFSIPNLTDSDFGMIGWNTTKELTNYPNYEYAVAHYSGSIWRLLNGAGFSIVQAGPLTVNAKARLERASGVVKIRYASNGVTFTDVHTFGTDNQRFYLNINMDADPKKLYGLQLSGFIKQSTYWNGSGNTYTNSSTIYGSPNFIEGVRVGSLTSNGVVTTSGGTGTLGVTTVLPVANGGTGTATPTPVAGTGISITGTWPNNTIASTLNPRAFITSQVIATDANITASAGQSIVATENLFTNNRTIDLSDLNQDNDYLEIYLGSGQNFNLSPTGQTLYFSDNTNTVTNFLTQLHYQIRRKNGRLYIIN